MKRILFTGGGSAGHVTPNLGLIERFREEGWQLCYVGSYSGIEREIVAPTGVEFHEISSGKLRRYFSWENFIDPFRILLGIVQAFLLCRRLSPDVVFSKGGFIAVPVVVGAWLNRIPVITHESDMTPGLANRICAPLAQKICVTFPQTVPLLASSKVVLTGTPVRSTITDGSADAGRRLLNLDRDRLTLLFFGGSLGASAINGCVHASLDQLLQSYQVIHICGAGNLHPDLDARAGYHQREYLHGEFGDVMACADLVISRAGANSIYELLILRKPHILIPLGLQSSRGDQVTNARTFASLGYSQVLPEEELNPGSLSRSIEEALSARADSVASMHEFQVPDSVGLISRLLIEAADTRRD